MNIAIQGVEGCYHQLAARQYFGNATEVIPCLTFSDLIGVVENNPDCDAGVMAIENSLAGSLLTNYHLLMESDLVIHGEEYVYIGHHLLGLPGQRIEDIREVRSHPMAIKQCTTFLRTLNSIKITETNDTALSAREIAEYKTANVAAIAGEICTSLYGLESLSPNIQTNKQNYTRFLVIKKKSIPQYGMVRDKASVYFRVADEPGSLLRVMQTIANNDINLTKIQSFPVIGEKWLYYFFADLILPEGLDFERIVRELRVLSNGFTVMGLYKNGL